VPIQFICPYCAATTEVDDKLAGQVGPCAHCGKAITIPGLNGGFAPISRRTTTTVVILLAMVLGVAIVGAAVLAAILMPAASSARDAALRASCTGNLKQIAAAMLQYESTYGCFPPAYIADKRGKPIHSWRILLLPHLGHQDLYDRYRFDEPWDSPRNRRISDLAIGLFQCPAQPASKQPITSYMMVVGPHTISSGHESRKITEITDGLKDTIMLVEVADSTIWWAEPEDLRFDTLNFTINNGKRQEISSYHPGGVNTALCDGSVRLLKDSMNPQLVKAMITIDESDQVTAE
jgi:prepilin-type processing-associated H-X9-DG protein